MVRHSDIKLGVYDLYVGACHHGEYPRGWHNPVGVVNLDRCDYRGDY